MIFTYDIAAVVLLSVAPDIGPTAGGTPVAISGRGFATDPPGPATVTIGGVAASSVVVETDERVTAIAPAHSAGPADVVVTNADGTIGSLPGGYVYADDPATSTGIRYRTPFGPASTGLTRVNPAPTIDQILGQPWTANFTTPLEPLGYSAVTFAAFGVVLFEGVITGTVARAEGIQKSPVWDATATNAAYLLARRYPVGSWIATSGTNVLIDLVAGWALGFSGAGIELGLSDVSIAFDGTTDLWSAMTQVGDACGAKLFLVGSTVYAFTVDSGVDPPGNVTADNPDLLYPKDAQAVTVEYDYTQIRNRVTVRGAEGIALTADDVASIATFGACEYPIHDNTLTTLAELGARAQVELAAYAQPVPTIRYATRDLKTQAGKTVVVALDAPAVALTCVIQTVRIDQLDAVVHGVRPRFTVTATPARVPMRRTAGAAYLDQTVVDLAARAKQSPKLDGAIESEPGGPTTIPDSSIPASALAGCIDSDLLEPTGVPPGDYGGAAHLVEFTVNAAGQITAAATDPVPVVKTDGSQPFTAPQSMGGQALVDVAGPPTDPEDAANKAYVDAAVAAGGGGTLPDGIILADGSEDFAADQSMGGFKLRDLAPPVLGADAVNLDFLEDAIAAIPGGGGSGGAIGVLGETPTGAVDGSNTVFTTAAAYTALAVYLNGLRQKKTAHYAETSGTTFTFVTAPLTGDLVTVDYNDGTSGGGAGTTGGRVLLASLTASASATLDFTTRNAPGRSGAIFQADYQIYTFEVLGIRPTNDDTIFRCRFSTTGGASWDASNLYHRTSFWSSTATAGGIGAVGAENQPQLDLCGIISNLGTSFCNGSMELRYPLDATAPKEITAALHFLHGGDGDRYRFLTTGWYLNNAAVNGIRFLMDTGTIAGGQVRIYGVPTV